MITSTAYVDTQRSTERKDRSGWDAALRCRCDPVVMPPECIVRYKMESSLRSFLALAGKRRPHLKSLREWYRLRLWLSFGRLDATPHSKVNAAGGSGCEAAIRMVVGVAYRLLPMVLPSQMPGGRAPWSTAILLEVGVLGISIALLLRCAMRS
jgi:hypothetical protein